jgi:hypothetical protein
MYVVLSRVSAHFTQPFPEENTDLKVVYTQKGGR